MPKDLNQILAEYLTEPEIVGCKGKSKEPAKPGWFMQAGKYWCTYVIVGLLTVMLGIGILYNKNHTIHASNRIPEKKIHASIKKPHSHFSLEKILLAMGKEPEIAVAFDNPAEYSKFIKSILPNPPKKLFDKKIYSAFKKGGTVLVYYPEDYFAVISPEGYGKIRQAESLDIKIKMPAPKKNAKNKQKRSNATQNSKGFSQMLEQTVRDAKVEAAKSSFNSDYINYKTFADARRAEIEKVCSKINRSLERASCLRNLNKNVYALISYTDEQLRAQGVNLPSLLVYAIPIIESSCRHTVPLQIQNGNKTFTVYAVSTGPSKDTGLYQITPPAFEQICYEVQNTPQIAAVYHNVMNVLVQGCDAKTAAGKAKQELYTRLRDNLTAADWDVFSKDINTNAVGGILYTAYCAMHGTGTAEDILAKYNGGLSVNPASNPKVAHHVKKGLEALTQLNKLFNKN